MVAQAKKTKSKSGKKVKKIVVAGRAYVKASFNNTLITITDLHVKPVSAGASVTLPE